MGGNPAHLDLARYSIDERGSAPHYFDAEARARGEDPAAFWAGTYEYNQSHLPVRYQTKVVGHAVRTMYMYAAMADLAADTGDASLLTACEVLWDDLTTKRMYVTGGFGPSASNEGVTTDYDLPNDTAYAETSASAAMVLWAARMLNNDLDGRYADILELALYNNVLAGLSQDGEHYFYDNKLESDGRHERWPWHPYPCCTMNASRLIASVGGYFCSVAKDEIALHLYGGASPTSEIAGIPVRVVETSGYPYDGNIRIALDAERAVDFTLSLRIPGRANGFSLCLNGITLEATPVNGYVRVNRCWAPGDLVELSIPMPPTRVYSHPAVRADRGRVAVRRGPLIYCAEQIDNEFPARLLCLPESADIEIELNPDLLGGITVLSATAASMDVEGWGKALYRSHRTNIVTTNLTMIPYFLWNNRGANEMAVWLVEPF